MGRSARKDNVRCSRCRKKGIITRPVIIKVTETGYNNYVKLKCLICGHIYTSTSKAAIRLARYFQNTKQ
jgi:hypothetical protein